MVARVPRPLQVWRPELLYGLYLVARSANWEPLRLYDPTDFVKTRFVLPPAARAQIDRLKARYQIAAYEVLTCALHHVAADPLVRMPTCGSAVAQLIDRRFTA